MSTGAAGAPAARRGWLNSKALASSALELERHVELGPIGFNFSLFVQLHIELDDLRNAQIAQGLCGSLHCVGGGIFPGFVAGPDQFYDLVDAIRHVVLPFRYEAGKQEFPAGKKPSITASGLEALPGRLNRGFAPAMVFLLARLAARRGPMPSSRANLSRECAPDDRLCEAFSAG
jgi:hypothetical protein